MFCRAIEPLRSMRSTRFRAAKLLRICGLAKLFAGCTTLFGPPLRASKNSKTHRIHLKYLIINYLHLNSREKSAEFGKIIINI